MENKISGIFKGDKVIWMVFFFFLIISVVEVFSSSSTLSYKSENYWAPAIKHLSTWALGIFLMIGVLNIDCKYFRIATPFLLLVSFVTLCYVLVAGVSENGASRWINVFGFQFQPSELAKTTLVLATAQVLSAMQTENGTEKSTMKYVMVTCAFLIGPVAFENLSTAMLMGLIMVLMMFIGKVPYRQLGRLLGVVFLIAAFFVGLVMLIGSSEEKTNDKQNLSEQFESKEKDDPSVFEKIFHRASTWKGRIQKFLSNEEVKPEDYDLDTYSQVGHANIAIASSNVVGKGPGNSVERDFLPQAFSDFIYAIIIEEMGIWGGAVVALLYIILLFRTGRIAARCENNFPAFLVMGLALMMVTQALFNMLVAVGLAPVTGQPLPLISKGGSSIVFSCINIGVILSVSRSARRKGDTTKERKRGSVVPA
ncbi:MAG: FtsW/RodA/SpoVE family cell cycle protein [Prevotella sp.]|nr:FtsW/RodA/SpoVE family cell cycle protein [Prevotella sp.]